MTSLTRKSTKAENSKTLLDLWLERPPERRVTEEDFVQFYTYISENHGFLFHGMRGDHLGCLRTILLPYMHERS